MKEHVSNALDIATQLNYDQAQAKAKKEHHQKEVDEIVEGLRTAGYNSLALIVQVCQKLGYACNATPDGKIVVGAPNMAVLGI